MQRKTGCWLLAGLIAALLVLAAGGVWLWMSTRGGPRSAAPVPLVSVELTAPTSGDEMKLGDAISIAAQAVSPNRIQKSELFVDGQSQGAVTEGAGHAYWTWRALASGVHALRAVSTDAAGNSGQSQTVLVNVLQGDGTVEVSAEQGQTLDQIGGGFGVPPEQMAAANPKLDATQPLAGDTQVEVPLPGAGGGGAAPGGGGSQGGGSQPGGEGAPDGPPYTTIDWHIEFKEAVDQAYCYESNGGGAWQKMPKDPFTFFPGVNTLYTQLMPLSETYEIQVECWGWVGGALKFLGEGKTQFTSVKPPPSINMEAGPILFTGEPRFIPAPLQVTGGGELNFPPPYSLREPISTYDCASHGNPVFSSFICDTLLNAKLKQYVILEWEWQAPNCVWPGSCQNTVKAADGYRIYKVSPENHVESYVKDIDNPAQKVTMVALGWEGATCYGVRAFTKSPEHVSAIDIYCPSSPPQAELATFQPDAWVTGGGKWMSQGDCGSSEPYLLDNKYKGYGNGPQVLVGRGLADTSSCYSEDDYSGGVRFPVKLPAGAVVQKALLKYSSVAMNYHTTGVASPQPASCLGSIKRSAIDWGGSSSGIHFDKSLGLWTPSAGLTITSINQWNNQPVDVSSAVASWLAHPEQNRGLNLIAAPREPIPDDYKGDGYSVCYSWLGNFELDVYYFVP